ncbi:MAG: RlpA-like double-psi beta-barrel domain-containing protein [Beijerinckiaceae bacterium]
MPFKFWLKTAALYALVALTFCVLARNFAHAETHRASWYGRESGKITAHSEHCNPYGFTAAHRSIAFGTMTGVRFGARKIAVRVNGRGPFVAGRCLDLSRRCKGARHDRVRYGADLD